MSLTPVEHASALRIGTVEFVSPDEIRVSLDLDSPEDIAANSGFPRPFPRINSYVLIPTEVAFVVSQLEWITIERTPFPKRKGFQDYGLVDLPFPMRKMRANPLGLLRDDASNGYYFSRGVESFPSVGDPVLLPTDNQLKAIVESGKNRRIKIGTSPLAGNASVSLDPDRLFGRHLAVLGNTGSGKSCSVAGLIQWSLDAACDQAGTRPNARFIILDPNGEYGRVFRREDFRHKARIFRVNDPDKPVQVPLWFWNSAEWGSFAQASPKTQKPLLNEALRAMRNELTVPEQSLEVEVKRFLGTLLVSIRSEIQTGSPWGSFPRPKGFFEKIKTWNVSLESYRQRLAPTDERLASLLGTCRSFLERRPGQYPVYEATVPEVDQLKEALRNAFTAYGGQEQELLPLSEDTPRRFTASTFLSYLEALAQQHELGQHVESLLMRVRTMLADTRMKSIIGDGIEITLAEWLERYIGGNEAENGCVTLVDLSLVPQEITHLVTAVIARMTLEALHRYRDHNTAILPTVLVMEEAHTFVKRYRDEEDIQSTATICCRVFEKIAREGRKFGLGLVLSSQRPSELSPTVLSQCNTFLLHRISNDSDQELVTRLVPDNLRGLLRELPSLPTQHAIILGWATELPVLVRMNDLSEEERPQSEDPAFWNVWTRRDIEGKLLKREVNWKSIADEWQEKPRAEGPPSEGESE
jgi:hypothetical protein